MNRAWQPHYLARWLFGQGKVWITADGRCKRVSTMDYDHALNTLLMVERVHADIERSIYRPVQETPLYAALKARVEAGP